MKVLIPFYSMYGHVYKMAQAVAEGVNLVEGASSRTMELGITRNWSMCETPFLR